MWHIFLISTFCRTGTEEQITELGNLLEQVVGYIDASSVSINQQTNAEASLSGEEEENTELATPTVPRVTNVTRRNEKFLADMERDELLNQTGKQKYHLAYIYCQMYPFTLHNI